MSLPQQHPDTLHTTTYYLAVTRTCKLYIHLQLPNNHYLLHLVLLCKIKHNFLHLVTSLTSFSAEMEYCDSTFSISIIVLYMFTTHLCTVLARPAVTALTYVAVELVYTGGAIKALVRPRLPTLVNIHLTSLSLQDKKICNNKNALKTFYYEISS